MTGLKVEGLKVVYQKAIIALEGVDLEVPENKIVALLGANGAGKTTTLRAISGFTPAENARIDAGSIRYRGEELRNLPPPATLRRGIVLVPERDKVFPNLTVEENLAVVATKASRAEHQELHDKVYHHFPRLSSLRRNLAGLLSGGERQMLAIGAALMSKPELMLIDELSLGLAPVTVDGLLDSLRNIQAETRMSILLVEQSATVALSISDYGYVLEHGRVQLANSAAGLKSDARVQEIYLGGGQKDSRDHYIEAARRRKKERADARA